MSRLIVKNLPSYVTPALLRQHFSQSKGPAGTITDVKVVLKQDGTARRFGFVGFKTNEEALKAKEWYDKTFIDSTRVRVEIIDVRCPSIFSTSFPGLYFLSSLLPGCSYRDRFPTKQAAASGYVIY